MKIILTGATGFIGAEILQECLANPTITPLIAISRRPLPPNTPNADNPKLKVVILEDFLSWPASVLEELKGAEGCIWTLGAPTSPSPAQNRLINLDYTMAAAKAFAETLAPQVSTFRFVYCSGFIAERDQEKSLWFMGDLRRMRGDVENQLLALGKEKSGFHPFIARPAGVLKKDGGILSTIMGLGPTVRVNELAATMVDIALKGNGNESERQIIENAELGRKGKVLLKNR